MERSGSYNRKPIPRSILIFAAAAGSLPGSFGLWLADASGPFWGWQTVYGWFQELARRFLFQMIRDIELTLDRERQGREASPSAALMRARRRLDASGTLPWNTDGRRLMVDLTTADISGSAGPGHSRWHPQALALGEASLRRRCLPSPEAHGKGQRSRLRHRRYPPQ